MNNLKAKLKKQGGFTLIEMLIVVAIIAILIAISIPLVNSALERARESTDAANERSFKAVLTVSYMTRKLEGTTDTFKVDTVYAYDAAKGTISETAPAKGYGKSTKVLGIDAEEREGDILFGKIDENGVVVMTWADTKPDTLAADSRLISPSMVSDL